MKWQHIDPTEFPQTHPTETEIRGVTVSVGLSPYDIPDAVRGGYDSSIEAFLIEFRYIGTEPWVRKKAQDHLHLRVGKHTKRLYGIEIDTAAVGAQRVELVLHQELDRLQSESKDTARQNYALAKEIIERQGGAFLREEVL